MAYFPFFVELEGRRGLIAGGGRLALAKARRLLDYGPSLLVVAPDVLPELEALPDVSVRRKPFEAADLSDGPDFAVAATDCPDVNRTVADLCQARRIPVNVVDTPEACTFLFPSLIRRGPLSIGISTGGTSPTAAIYLKEEIRRLLPEGVGDLLEWLGRERGTVRARTDGGAERKAVYRRLWEEGLRLGRPLTDAETEAILCAGRDGG